MAKDRAFLWIGVSGLIALGFIVGQAAAVAVAAMVGATLVYERAKSNTI